MAATTILAPLRVEEMYPSLEQESLTTFVISHMRYSRGASSDDSKDSFAFFIAVTNQLRSMSLTLTTPLMYNNGI
jgi:hypothetical protein